MIDRRAKSAASLEHALSASLPGASHRMLLNPVGRAGPPAGNSRRLHEIARKDPPPHSFSVSAFSQAAETFSGDVCEVLPLTADSALLVIADVMGKGQRASVFATQLRSLIQSRISLAEQPGVLLAKLNAGMFAGLSADDTFITAKLVHVNTRSRIATFANAGHCPMLVSSGGNRIDALTCDGMPLGIVENAGYPEHIVRLDYPTRLVLFTDGLTEARNAHGEFFGLNRLIDSLTRHGGAPTAEQCKLSILSTLAQFHSQRSDDLSLLVFADEMAVPQLAGTRTTTPLSAVQTAPAPVAARETALEAFDESGARSLAT
jgi:hypothetical protein